ncbi:prepronociceptin-like [Xyrauchen texanus]|uniref:prepronociceptin-like n=1 Tax=Xyrauchen texanus TaxID=154827 RepID=UPI0022422AA7|nr:prepronociceptin-like [Xyrauchen texanus]XP_051952519.1 prepronociceptin-like [Xyrauchen texanus]
MKTPFWNLLLLSLCVSGHSNCQGDCLTCGLLLPEHQAFNTLVCILECEDQASPALTWDLCYQAAGLNQLSLPLQQEKTSKRSENEVEPLATVSIENDNGVEYTEALEQFRHAAQALRSQQPSEDTSQTLGISYDPDLDPGTEQEQDGVDVEEEKSGEAAVSLSKRFGGFIKGRQGFRKLVSSGRSLQKRYGGFIGIRKSARKWNNQKRVSQLLRQYLSMTGRSGRSGRISARNRRQDEV